MWWQWPVLKPHVFPESQGIEQLAHCLTRTQELASPCPHRSPQVRGELLRVLMLQDELSDSALPQGPGSPHGPDTTLLLDELAVHEGDQLALHGPAKHALRHTAQSHN